MAPKKLLVVFGATGQQGSSVISHVLASPDLSSEYSIRAISRDPSSAKCKALSAQGVEVVAADMSDSASIPAALAGAHTVFAMSNFSMITPLSAAIAEEFNQVKVVADTAFAQGVQYFIFSTLPSIAGLSGGKFKRASPFEAKYQAEQYIRSLLFPAGSSFFSPGSFMENLSAPFTAPRKGTGADEGKYIWEYHVRGTTKVPYIYASRDAGLWIGAILANPEEFKGRILEAATAYSTYEEVAAAMSRTTGKTVVYRQTTEDGFRQKLAVLPTHMTDIFVDTILNGEENGYYGPQGEELVRRSAEVASRRGKLTTVEAYLQ